MLRLFCFVSFSFSFAFTEDAALCSIVLLSSFNVVGLSIVQSLFDVHAPWQPSTVSYLKTVCVIFFFLPSLEMSLFPSIFVPLPFSLCIESTSYVSPLPDGVFLPCDHGLDF